MKACSVSGIAGAANFARRLIDIRSDDDFPDDVHYSCRTLSTSKRENTARPNSPFAE